jgi:hypothetical protein
MPVGLEDRQRRLAQEMELAKLMRNAGQRPFHRAADRGLAVADHPHHRHAHRIRHLPQQRGEIRGRTGQQAARQQHLAGDAVAHHPEHLMSNVGLQTIQC